MALRGHDRAVWGLTLWEGFDTLISGARDGRIKIWDLRERSLVVHLHLSINPIDNHASTCLRSLAGHTDCVHNLLTTDPTTAISASWD